MAKDSFKTVSFRLNLEKQDEREIYEYLESIDQGNQKQELGDKSKFLKMLVKEWIADEVATEAAENKLHEEEIFQKTLLENLSLEVEKGNESLVKVLPELIRTVVKEVLTDGVITVAPKSTDETIAFQKEAEEVLTAGVLPESGAEIPDDAFDFIDNL
ncbi:MAG: hypothetical protein PHX08_07580 [Lachnospiraceae bacterium]|nr:hypothetical protein [Lachnospiraceae bacterium]